MLSERGVWVAYEKLSAALDRDKMNPPSDATYLEDLRDMALQVAQHIEACPTCEGTGDNAIHPGVGFKCFDCNGRGYRDRS